MKWVGVVVFSVLFVHSLVFGCRMEDFAVLDSAEFGGGGSGTVAQTPQYTLEAIAGPKPPGLVQQLIDLAGSAFGKDVGTPNGSAGPALADGKVYLARDASGQLAGFSVVERQTNPRLLEGTRYQNATGSYFAAAAILPEHQGSSLYRDLNDARLRDVINNRDAILFLRTQNPRVEAGIRSMLTRAVAAGQLRGFTLGLRRRMNGAYGQMLSSERPTVPNAEIQRQYDLLDSNAGDAYVLVFELRYP